jgi:hypothetical protein
MRLILFLLAYLICLAPAHAVVGGLGPDEGGERSEFAGVGAIEVIKPNGKIWTVTGALIDRRHVLCSAHTSKGKRPAELTFIVHRGTASTRLPVEAIFVHPDHRRPGQDKNSPGARHDDLAILRLAQPAPEGVPVYPLLARPIRGGQVITFVGYGRSEEDLASNGPGSEPHRDNRIRRIGLNLIEALYPDDEGGLDAEVFEFDYDPPGEGMPGEATFAVGDSGGPVFVRDDGRWKMLGVMAYVRHGPDGPGTHGSLGGGMLVHPYMGWIRAVLAGEVEPYVPRARSAPAPEPEPALETDAPTEPMSEAWRRVLAGLAGWALVAHLRAR